MSIYATQTARPNGMIVLVQRASAGYEPDDER